MVITIAPLGALIFANFPAATGLRTKRTQCIAGASAVKWPCPLTNAGSSRRRTARPTQVMPEPRVPCSLIEDHSSVGRRSCALLQRPTHDRAHKVATVMGIGLMILERIDCFGGSLGCSDKHCIAGCVAIQACFGFQDAAR